MILIVAVAFIVLSPIVAGAALMAVLREYDKHNGTEQLDEVADSVLDVDDNDGGVGVIEEFEELHEEAHGS